MSMKELIVLLNFINLNLIMSKIDLTFTKENGLFVSNTFTVHGNTAVHIEKAFEGQVTIKQRTGLDEGDEDDDTVMFDETYTMPSFKGCKEADIIGYVFPKQIKLICPVANLNKFVESATMDDNVKAYYIGE